MNGIRTKYLALGIAAALGWTGAVQAEDGLSRQAAQAFARGLAAAGDAQWEAAAEAFHQTVMGFDEHNAGGCLRVCSPEVYLNLGLAHARAGHPLLAAGWLAVYLDQAPGAPNAAAVRAEFERTRRTADDTLVAQRDQIFQEAVAAAEAMQGSFLSVAEEMAGAGEMERALQLATRGVHAYAEQYWNGLPERDAKVQQELDETRSRLWTTYARALARRGRLEEAQALLTHITTAKDRDTVRDAIQQRSSTAAAGDGLEGVYWTVLKLETSPANDAASAVQQASQESRVPEWLARTARAVQEARWDLEELARHVAVSPSAPP